MCFPDDNVCENKMAAVLETFRNYFFASIGAKFCLLGHFYFVLDKIIIPPPRPLILPIFHTIDELVHQVCDPL